MNNKLFSLSALPLLLRYTPKKSGLILFATITTVLNKLLDFLPEMFLGLSIDIVMQNQNSWINTYLPYASLTQLKLLGVITLFAWIIESCVEYAAKYAWGNLALSIQHELRVKLFEHIQKLDLTFFDTTHVGKIISVVNDDVHQLERFFGRGIMELIKLVFGSLIALAIFTYISPLIMILMLIPIPFILLLSNYFHTHFENLYHKVRSQGSVLLSHMTSAFFGIMVIKSYAAEKAELDMLTQESEQYHALNLTVMKHRSLFIPLVRTTMIIGFISALLIGGFQVLSGYLSVGFYSIIVIMTQRFLWPFTDLPKITDMYSHAIASAKRITDLLEITPTIKEGNIVLDKNTVKGEIVFNHVSFSYTTHTEILHDISFTIQPGTTAAFVGQTGSGKSTIAKLLLRFYEPTEGEIFIDAHNIKSFTFDSLRNSIGFVSQEPFLRDTSVKENIRYGAPFSDFDDIIETAKIVDAHGFITSLEFGYETHVGDGGQKLSGGQKQRISIARALIKNSPIFIFDEITSSLDTETESYIQESMSNILKNKHTTIIIAHRLKMVENANIIFVLDHGKIVESGNHQELLNKNGFYKKLYDSNR